MICSPNDQLKLIQRRLTAILKELYSPKIITHGYVKGRSIVSNALVHKNKACVLNIDLKDFFDSIHIGRVIGLFKSKPFSLNQDIATKLACLVCYRHHLPQGAPTSPIISNFICRKLDNDLIKLTSKYKIVCTRYCDDITISSDFNSLPPGIIVFNDNHYIIGTELENVIRGNDFLLNYEKLRFHSKNNRQTVTGLVVNKKVNIQKSKYRHFRAIMHSVAQKGLEETAERNGYKNGDMVDTEAFKRYLRGTIEYYKMVLSHSSDKYQRFAQQYNTFVEKGALKITPSFDDLQNTAVYIIEDRANMNQGTAFFVKNIGFVTCLHNVYKSSKLDIDKIKEVLLFAVLYLPSQPDRLYKAKYVAASAKYDLLVLEIDENPKLGYEINTNPNYARNVETVATIGYPSNSEPHVNRDATITYKEVRCGMTLYCISKSIFCGDSGGPVLDKNNRVVGYIDRGNKIGEKEEEYNAFCPITHLLEIVDYNNL